METADVRLRMQCGYTTVTAETRFGWLAIDERDGVDGGISMKADDLEAMSR